MPFASQFRFGSGREAHGTALIGHVFSKTTGLPPLQPAQPVFKLKLTLVF
jgi:hypothetical protein